jgi:Holliday junction resolvase RusA-like endonuclease
MFVTDDWTLDLSTKVALIVPGEPYPQPRARAVRRGNFVGVTSQPTKAAPINVFRASVQAAAAEKFTGHVFDGPVWCQLTFVFSRPKYLLKRGIPDGRIRHWQKCDRDNLEKGVLDALKGFFWIDDKQVSSGEVSKWYACRTELPHTVIEICQFVPPVSQ